MRLGVLNSEYHKIVLIKSKNMVRTSRKTPGVYTQEQDAYGISIVAAPTDIPVFIGYTSQIFTNEKNALNHPVKVSSLAEFHMIFGTEAPQVQFGIDPTHDSSKRINHFSFHEKDYILAPTTINYRMYSSLKFFYENGGGECYILSIGSYDYSKNAITDTTEFKDALVLLEQETEPTMLVIPDLMEINEPTANPFSDTYLQDKYLNAYALQSEMINHCARMKNRVALLDIPGGFSEPLMRTTSVQQFRASVAPKQSQFNSYAAAYYPWLNTTVYSMAEISYANINEASYPQVAQLLTTEFTNVKGVLDPEMAKVISAFSEKPEMSLDQAQLILQSRSKVYLLILGGILKQMNLMAPSAAIAGIFTLVDSKSGVWKSPSNVEIQSTLSPAVTIDNMGQDDLNMPLYGKSINAIREFTGRGNLVWGARTLDGNSPDWRYINVRRTTIFIEKSIQEATKAQVFEPNNANTWATLKSMITHFLDDLWKRGALAGSKPNEAFKVSIGLGSTMTDHDILNGIMKVSIQVAIIRPSEFIEITFQQQMQEA